jgi:cytochrome c oxidase subunit I
MSTVGHANECPEAAGARRWLMLAVGSLLLAGLLALLLVGARTPVLSRAVTDPAFFRRCLVVHVDLSLLVWIYAFAGALIFLLPARNASSRTSRAGVFVSATGVGMLLLAAGAPGALPVLANYVPVIDHWLFLTGLAVFGAGVLLSVLDRRLLPSAPSGAGIIAMPDAVLPGLRATAIALVLAALTFAGSWLAKPRGLEPRTLYELGNWGGGHVLQLASSAAMVSVWLLMLNGVLGRAPVSRRAASFGFAALLLPWAGAPLLALAGPDSVPAREGFTILMRWAIFPPVAFFLVSCSLAVAGGFRRGVLTRRSLRDPRLVGFVASAFLTLLGWTLGAFIRGSNTVIPAHYHAAIGAVTVAFMAFSYPLLEALSVPIHGSRFARRFVPLQPLMFGVGQSVFAVGFALAGAHGMGRKIYGAEQHARTALETLGMGVMGAGGLLAISSGVVFLSIVVGAWVRREQAIAREWALSAGNRAGGTHG